MATFFGAGSRDATFGFDSEGAAATLVLEVALVSAAVVSGCAWVVAAAGAVGTAIVFLSTLLSKKNAPPITKAVMAASTMPK